MGDGPSNNNNLFVNADIFLKMKGTCRSFFVLENLTLEYSTIIGVVSGVSFFDLRNLRENLEIERRAQIDKGKKGL